MTVSALGTAEPFSPAPAARVGLLLPLCLAGFAAVATAQRFDNWVSAPGLGTSPATNMATHPTTGAPTMVVFTPPMTGTDTVAWDGTSFVSLGLTNNPGGAGAGGEALAPFVAGGTAGLVCLDNNGNTSVWTGGAGWTSLGVLTPSPGPRGLAGVASAVGFTGEAFLFGGSAGGSLRNDLWSFNGSTWTNRTPATGPLPLARIGGGLMTDGQGGLLLYGGDSSGTGAAPLNDLWAWNGAQWRLVGKGPAVRSFASTMLDVSRSVMLLAGGQSTAGAAFDAWTLPVPVPATVAAVDWTLITASLPFSGSVTGLTTGALDAARNEPVLADQFGPAVVNDRVASMLTRGTSPAPCIAPNLQLVGGVQPRIGTSTVLVPIGGLTGVVGAPMLLFAEFAVPGIGFSSITPIPGTPCFSFLSPAAINIGATATLAGGQYQFDLVLPPNPTLAGTVVDVQALGVIAGQLAATEAGRIVIGR